MSLRTDSMPCRPLLGEEENTFYMCIIKDLDGQLGVC